MPTRPTTRLEAFPNPNPERDYEISFDCPEFTCLCPRTGQPDFATIRIRYTPDRRCVELKSLKLYLWSYRNRGAFHEAVTNRILDDLVRILSPRRMTVEGDFYVRGGIHTRVVAAHGTGQTSSPESTSGSARRTALETAPGATRGQRPGPRRGSRKVAPGGPTRRKTPHRTGRNRRASSSKS